MLFDENENLLNKIFSSASKIYLFTDINQRNSRLYHLVQGIGKMQKCNQNNNIKSSFLPNQSVSSTFYSKDLSNFLTPSNLKNYSIFRRRTFQPKLFQSSMFYFDISKKSSLKNSSKKKERANNLSG